MSAAEPSPLSVEAKKSPLHAPGSLAPLVFHVNHSCQQPKHPTEITMKPKQKLRGNQNRNQEEAQTEITRKPKPAQLRPTKNDERCTKFSTKTIQYLEVSLVYFASLLILIKQEQEQQKNMDQQSYQ